MGVDFKLRVSFEASITRMLGTRRRILGVRILSCCIEGPLPRAKNCRCQEVSNLCA